MTGVNESRFSTYLEEAEVKGLRRSLREVHPISARECFVDGADGPVLDFSSNNYLALADHTHLKEEAVRWTNLLGTGSRASRLVSGSFPELIDLERRIAQWKGTEDALIIGSGYMANTGVIPALLSRKSAIFADKLNHASLNAGCRLSGARFFRYRHNDTAALAEKLEKENGKFAETMIVSDTVFSMEGDIADIPALRKAADDAGAMLYLDDAHATGLFGDKGEGLAHGVAADIIMGTFSKAMGGYGAYIACSKVLKEYLVNRCGSFIYTTALPPGVYGAVSAAVELVQTDEFREVRRKLLEKSAKFADELKRNGFDVGNTSTPVIPVILRDTEKTVRISQNLLKKGMLAVAIRPPTVPEGTARLRISLNAEHTEEDLERLADALKVEAGI